MRKILLVAASVLAGALACARPAAGQAAPLKAPEVVDCVAAVVNGRAITLVDVRIAEGFGLVEADPAATIAARQRTVLERLIDRKVLIDFTRERAPADPDKVARELGRLLSRLGRDETVARLAAFGLSGEDLRPYVEEAVLSESIVSNRFSHGPAVSLREIEAYYAGAFVPGQAKLGRTAPPLIDVLDALEAELKAAKTESQIALWIQNLRKQADIEIRPGCLGR